LTVESKERKEKTKHAGKLVLGNYLVIPIAKLKPTPIREIREENVERIKLRIQQKGFNPSRVLIVVKEGDDYLVAAGNHRLLAAKKAGLKAVPCLVVDADIYTIAIRDNQDEETFAKLDVFDWVQIIGKLRKEGLTQKEIGEKIGWSESQIKNYSMLLSRIVTQVLDLSKKHQEGRVTEKVTHVTFNFTEYWFRTSGLYDLNEKYQLDCIERFIADKCQWSKNLLQKETAKYMQWLESISIAKEKLVDETKLDQLVALIENNTFTSKEQLMDKINSLNKESKNKLICGNALEELPKLDDASIDIVIIDPPYGLNYSSNWSKDSDYMSKKEIKNDGLEEALTLLNKTLKILDKKTKANSHFYIFTSWKVYPQIQRIISKYFEIKNLLVWFKRAGLGLGDLKHTWGGGYDLIVFATKGKRPVNMRKYDVLEVTKITVNRTKIHPNQKPTALIKELLDVSFQVGDTVCDCFMGSGSTIKALLEYGVDVNYIGIELDKTMFEKAKSFIFGGKE